MSHILVLNGSARPNAFTAAMIRAFRSGAESVGHTVTVIDLCKLNIHSCIGCLNGGKDPCEQSCSSSQSDDRVAGLHHFQRYLCEISPR